MTSLFYNGRVFKGGEIVKDDLWTRDGKVIDPTTVNYVCDDSVDCNGSLICPGFIDVKVNGAFGVDFTNAEEVATAMSSVRQEFLQRGVTSILPSVVTTSPDVYRKVLPLLSYSDGSAKVGATILGAHLDGPFINPSKAGGHPTEFIQEKVSMEALDSMFGPNWKESVKLVALAPELEGCVDVIKELTAAGIVVSLGHSAATYTDGVKAVEAGACMLSHLFNAMPSFHHRDPSLVGLLASDLPRPLYFGIIADGIHTHEAAQRMAHKIAPDSLILLSDGTPAVGLQRGTYEMLGQKVEVKGSPPAAFVAETDDLLGSVATLDQCVRRLRRNTNCTVEDALLAATYRPAKLLGIEKKKGTLDVGADADFVFLTEELSVTHTFIGSKLAWSGAGRTSLSSM
ncbi:MAG: hypothetical protein KVP17_000756 [Porospora cf. gigantea B]|uniref:uncharacterized protein n=1 Tax=Porospora cf. gigantea B TaxID=2853592 RepID=UPI0035717F73|nr:MAG: hypothetical protein KVP17_000756 [Porospora cf. gigantea B]